MKKTYINVHNIFRTRTTTIKSRFLTDLALNEIGYDYAPNRGETLFWSLPSSFTGNKVDRNK